MLTKGEERRAADADQLGVHLVIADVVSLDRAEGASAYVERDVQHGRALSAQLFEDCGGEVQARCGGCYRAFGLGIDRLIGRQILLLRLTPEVGRDGEDTHQL